MISRASPPPTPLSCRHVRSTSSTAMLAKARVPNRATTATIATAGRRRPSAVANPVQRRGASDAASLPSSPGACASVPRALSFVSRAVSNRPWSAPTSSWPPGSTGLPTGAGKGCVRSVQLLPSKYRSCASPAGSAYQPAFAIVFVPVVCLLSDLRVPYLVSTAASGPERSIVKFRATVPSSTGSRKHRVDPGWREQPPCRHLDVARRLPLPCVDVLPPAAVVGVEPVGVCLHPPFALLHPGEDLGAILVIV
jgi:hypothetical protein